MDRMLVSFRQVADSKERARTSQGKESQTQHNEPSLVHVQYYLQIPFAS